MSMMYKIVADALRKEGLNERHPQEYLNFYCLGKREVLTDVSTTSNSNDNSALVTNLRRGISCSMCDLDVFTRMGCLPFLPAFGPEIQEVHDLCALKRDDCRR